MTKTVGIDEYWSVWLDKMVKSGVRPSAKHIVEEALGRFLPILEHENDLLEEAKGHVSKRLEEEKEENPIYD